MKQRFGIVDAQYWPDNSATGALAVYSDALYSDLIVSRCTTVASVEPYRSGEFFRRELPIVRALLVDELLDLVIVDGYVDLDQVGRRGLGSYVFGEFGIPVIGIAKTEFRSATHAEAVLRGSSQKPLWVTARGVDPVAAADLVKNMSGVYRVPDAARYVDSLARRNATPTVSRGSRS